jgi:hypothetical protein
MVFQLADQLHCTAAEVAERVSVRELIDWLGFYRWREAKREQAREVAKAKRDASRRGRRASN